MYKIGTSKQMRSTNRGSEKWNKTPHKEKCTGSWGGFVAFHNGPQPVQ